MTGVAALGELRIPVVLVVLGVGSFTGVTAAGRLSDQRPGLVLAAGGPVLLIGRPARLGRAGRPAGHAARSRARP